jgi:Pyruvate/2-oxoacid:ferredoxin oxidoreductase delta subunit
MAQNDRYKKLAERLNYPPSELLIKILKKMATEQETEILLSLPAPIEQLAQKFSCSQADMSKTLEEFLARGLAVSTSKGPQFVREVTQLHDASLASADKYVDPELLDLWKEFYEKEWRKHLGEEYGKMQRPLCRVIPAWKSLERSNQISHDAILPEENMIEIMRGAEKIAVVPCSCRRPLRNCDAPLDVCFQFNKWADYAVKRGSGKTLSLEQALEANAVAEEAGLVHIQPMMTSSLSLICSCCADCCALIDPGVAYGTVNNAVLKSRYRPMINPETCTGCQECVDRCPFIAIEMKKLPQWKKLKASLIGENCVGCGVCAVGCEAEAINMRLVEAA